MFPLLLQTIISNQMRPCWTVQWHVDKVIWRRPHCIPPLAVGGGQSDVHLVQSFFIIKQLLTRHVLVIRLTNRSLLVPRESSAQIGPRFVFAHDELTDR